MSDPNLAGIIVYAPIINGESFKKLQTLNLIPPFLPDVICFVQLSPPTSLGIGGSLVSIQSSRISTKLHLYYQPSEVPADRRKCYNLFSIFFGSGKTHEHVRTHKHTRKHTYTVRRFFIRLPWKNGPETDDYSFNSGCMSA